MKKRILKNSFTLVEIIVVLVILGILASIALPTLFRNIKKEVAAEGLSQLNAYKQIVEGCITVHNNNDQGDSCGANLNTLFVSSKSFNYGFIAPQGGVAPLNSADPTNSNVTYTLVANANGAAYGLSPGTDYITLMRQTTTGQYTCTFYGALLGATSNAC